MSTPAPVVVNEPAGGPGGRPSDGLPRSGPLDAAFGAPEWDLVTAIASIWGSSFVLIAIGLGTFTPAVVAFARLALGLLTILAFPGARRRLPRADTHRAHLAGVVWMGAPLLLFPIAQQWVASSVAGMINGAMPLFATLVWVVVMRRSPGRVQLVGIVVGFVGIVAVALPSARGADASPLGVALLLIAVLLYGIATNLIAPLQRRHGALPVVVRAQAAGVVVLLPFALFGLDDSSWSWSSALAMIPLGVLGSGVAFLAMTTLVGRAGADRGSIAIYFVPIVAIVLGVILRGESVHVLQLAGTALVIVGAWLTSRKRPTAPQGVTSAAP